MREFLHPIHDVDWDQAVCRGVDTDIFYDGWKVDEAGSYCKICPIQKDCRDYGLAFEEHGIWGGVAVDGDRRRAHHKHEAWYRATEDTHCRLCTDAIAKGDPVMRKNPDSPGICPECAS